VFSSQLTFTKLSAPSSFQPGPVPSMNAFGCSAGLSAGTASEQKMNGRQTTINMLQRGAFMGKLLRAKTLSQASERAREPMLSGLTLTPARRDGIDLAEATSRTSLTLRLFPVGAIRRMGIRWH